MSKLADMNTYIYTTQSRYQTYSPHWWLVLAWQTTVIGRSQTLVTEQTCVYRTCVCLDGVTLQETATVVFFNRSLLNFNSILSRLYLFVHGIGVV